MFTLALRGKTAANVGKKFTPSNLGAEKTVRGRFGHLSWDSTSSTASTTGA